MTRSRRVLAGPRPLLLMVLLPTLAGCGVMFGGTTQTLSVASAPSEARLTTEPLTGSFTTPAVLTLERKRAYTLVVWKEGYQEEQFQVQKKIRTGPLILDILFTGLVGVVVDAATGGWWSLQPDQVSVTLQRVDASVPGPEQIVVSISPSSDSGSSVRVEATEAVRIEVIQN